MKKLEGKVAVVTEAVGSVGLATVRKFVDEGNSQRSTRSSPRCSG
jgi:hypothetical protein